MKRFNDLPPPIMLTRILLLAALLAPAACATTGYTPGPANGFYRFEARAGDAVFPGTLHIQHRGDSVHCVLVLDRAGSLSTQYCDLDGDDLDLLAQGDDMTVHVSARVSPHALTGFWTLGSADGPFFARR